MLGARAVHKMVGMENSDHAPDGPSGTPFALGVSAHALVRAPRGPSLSCKSWQQEAALRMLMNSLDPDVTERSERPVASGKLGRVPADDGAFRATVDALRSQQNDQTLLVHAGKSIRTIRTQENAARVLIVDSDSAANWAYIGPQAFVPMAFELVAAASCKYFNGSLVRKLVATAGLDGLGAAAPLAATMNGAAFLGVDQDADRIKRRVKAGFCDVMVNDLDEALRILKNAVRKGEPVSVGLAANPFDVISELASRGVVPDLLMPLVGEGDDVDDRIPHGMDARKAAQLRDTDVAEFCRRIVESVGAVGEAVRTLQKLGSIVVSRFPDNWKNAAAKGVTLPRTGPLVVSTPDLLAPMIAEGAAPIRWVALSGEPSDIRRVDRLLLETSPENETLRSWITAVQNRVRHQGLPARSCILRPAERAKFGMAVNDLVARGETKAPVLIVRDRADFDCVTSATQSDDAIRNPGAPFDSADVESLLDLADGATWASFQRCEGKPPRIVAQAVVADGRKEMSARVAQVLSR